MLKLKLPRPNLYFYENKQKFINIYILRPQKSNFIMINTVMELLIISELLSKIVFKSAHLLFDVIEFHYRYRTKVLNDDRYLPLKRIELISLIIYNIRFKTFRPQTVISCSTNHFTSWSILKLHESRLLIDWDCLENYFSFWFHIVQYITT